MRRWVATLLAAHAVGLATPGAALNGCTEGRPWAGLVCPCKAGPWETNWKTEGVRPKDRHPSHQRCCLKDCRVYSSMNYVRASVAGQHTRSATRMCRPPHRSAGSRTRRGGVALTPVTPPTLSRFGEYSLR